MARIHNRPFPMSDIELIFDTSKVTTAVTSAKESLTTLESTFARLGTSADTAVAKVTAMKGTLANLGSSGVGAAAGVADAASGISDSMKAEHTKLVAEMAAMKKGLADSRQEILNIQKAFGEKELAAQAKFNKEKEALAASGLTSAESKAKSAADRLLKLDADYEAKKASASLAHFQTGAEQEIQALVKHRARIQALIAKPDGTELATTKFGPAAVADAGTSLSGFYKTLVAPSSSAAQVAAIAKSGEETSKALDKEFKRAVALNSGYRAQVAEADRHYERTGLTTKLESLRVRYAAASALASEGFSGELAFQRKFGSEMREALLRNEHGELETRLAGMKRNAEAVKSATILTSAETAAAASKYPYPFAGNTALAPSVHNAQAAANIKTASAAADAEKALIGKGTIAKLEALRKQYAEVEAMMVTGQHGELLAQLKHGTDMVAAIKAGKLAEITAIIEGQKAIDAANARLGRGVAPLAPAAALPIAQAAMTQAGASPAAHAAATAALTESQAAAAVRNAEAQAAATGRIAPEHSRAAQAARDHAAATATVHTSYAGLNREANAFFRGAVQGFGMLSNSMVSIIPMMLGFGMASAFMKTLKVGSEFEQSMFVIGELAGTSAEKLVEVRSRMLEIGASTQYGPLEAAKGMETLSLAGLNANDALKALLPTMQFAAAGGVTMAAAAETLVAVSIAYRYSAESYSVVGDLIAKTAADTMSSVTNMAEAFKTSSVLAQQYGISLQDTAAALGMLANIGITGTAAGTAWRNMITEFNKGTGKAAFGIQAMGVEMRNLDGSTKPIMEVMEGMSKFLVTLDAAGQNKMLQDITNERGSKATAGFQAKVLAQLHETNPLLQEQINHYNSIGDKTAAIALGQDAVAIAYKKTADAQKEAQDRSAGFDFFANLEEQMLPAKQMKGILASLETDFEKAFKGSSDSLQNFGNTLRETINSPEFISSLTSIVSGLTSFVGTIVNATAYVIKHGESILSFVGNAALAVTAVYALSAALGIYAAAQAVVATSSVFLVGSYLTFGQALLKVVAATQLGTAAMAAYNLVCSANPIILAASVLALGFVALKTWEMTTADKAATVAKEKLIAKQEEQSKALQSTLDSQLDQLEVEERSAKTKFDIMMSNFDLETRAQNLERDAFALKTKNGKGWQAEYDKLTGEAKALRDQEVTGEKLAAKLYGEAMKSRIDDLEAVNLKLIDNIRLKRISNTFDVFLGQNSLEKIEAINKETAVEVAAEKEKTKAQKDRLQKGLDNTNKYHELNKVVADARAKASGTPVTGANSYEGQKKKEFTRAPSLENAKIETSNLSAETAKRSALLLSKEKAYLDDSRIILKAGLDSKAIDAGAYAARDLQITLDSERNSLKTLADSSAEEARLHKVAQDEKQRAVSDFMAKNATSTKGYDAALANLKTQATNLDNTYASLKEKNLVEKFKLESAAASRFAAQIATVVGETKEAKKVMGEFFKEESRTKVKAKDTAALEEALRYADPEMAAGIRAQATELNRVNDLVHAQAKAVKTLTDEQSSQNAEVLASKSVMEEKRLVLEGTSSLQTDLFDKASEEYSFAVISYSKQNALLTARNEKLGVAKDYLSELSAYAPSSAIEAGIAARTAADKAYNASLTVGVADALIEGMANGAASGAKKFRDVIVAELRKPITLMIQAMVNPVVSGMTSAMGLTGSTVGSTLSAVDMLSAGGSASSLLGGTLTQATQAFSAFSNAAVGGVQSMMGLTGTAAQLNTALATAPGLYAPAAAVTGGAAAGSAFAAAVPYIGAAVLAYSLLSADHGKPTENTGSAARAFDIKGNLTGTETYYGGSSTGADAMIAKMQTAYMKGAESLGITMAASNFNYSGNTGKNGEAPNFALGGGAGGKSFQQAETPLDQTSIELAASRAIFTALQGSTLPTHLAGVFDKITASTATQAEITDAIAGAQALAAWHEQLKALPFTQLTNSSYAAMQNLLAAAGGIDKFSTNLQGYYANFYTAEEKTATLTKSTQKAFEDLGLVMPALDGSTRANYRSMVEELGAKDLSVIANAKAYTSVLALQDAVSQLSPAIEDVSKTILGFDAAGLSKMMLDAAFNPTAGMTAAQSFGAALEYSIQSTLINSAMGSIATSIYNSIVMPIATGVAVSQAVTDGVVADARAKMEALATLFKSDSFKGALAGIAEAVGQIMPSVTPLASSYVAPAAPVAVTADTAAADAKSNLTAKLALEAQLAELTKDTVEAERVLAAQRQMSIADLNAQDTSGELAKLTKQLWSLEDAAKVAAEALVQSNSVLALQAQIAELTKDTHLAEKVLAAQRQASVVELMKTDATGELATLTKELWKLQDAAKAAAAIATLTTAISSTLDKYQTPEQKLGRSYMTMAQDLLNAGLQGFTLDGLTSKLLSSTKENMAQFVREVFALEGVSVETKTAVLGVASAFADVKDTSIASAKSVADLAYSALERAVAAQKAAITITRDLAQTQVTTLQSLFDLLKTNVSELYKEVKATSSDASSRQFIDQALSTAQATGYLPELEALTTAISTVRGNMVETNYSTQFEMDRDRLILAGKLNALKDLTGTQLTTAEKALKTANEQLTALDDILTNNKKQLDAANGIDVSVISVEAAVQGVKTAIGDLALALGSTAGETPAQKAAAAALLAQQQAAALAAKKAAVLAGTPVFDVPTKTTVVDQITAAATAANITPEMQLYQTATSSGYTAAQVDKSMGWAPGTSNAWAAEKGLPTFATGINFVPNDMVARIHEGEAVVPKAYNPFNPAAKSNANQSESSTANEIKNLREETRAQAFSQAQLNLRMVKVLERWENQGLPEVRVL